MRAPRATCLASRKWTGETRERVDPTASHAARFAWNNRGGGVAVSGNASGPLAQLTYVLPRVPARTLGAAARALDDLPWGGRVGSLCTGALPLPHMRRLDFPKRPVERQRSDPTASPMQLPARFAWSRIALTPCGAVSTTGRKLDV